MMLDRTKILIPLLLSGFLAFTVQSLAGPVVEEEARESENNSEAQRFISLAPHLTEVLFAVGAGDEVVGVVSYSDFPLEALDIPRIGSYDKINYELILAMQPTLVFGWDSGNGEDTLARLRELNIPVYSHEPKSFEDVGESLRLIGEMTGHAEEGRLASDEYLARLEALRQAYENRDPIRVYYQIWNEPQMTVNGTHLISKVIELCGGVNVFADAIPLVPKIGIESVLLKNPQVIIAAGMGEERPEWLDDWAEWPAIEAAKNGHLFSVNPDYMHRHGPRILDGAEQLCSYLDDARE